MKKFYGAAVALLCCSLLFVGCTSNTGTPTTSNVESNMTSEKSDMASNASDMMSDANSKVNSTISEGKDMIDGNSSR